MGDVRLAEGLLVGDAHADGRGRRLEGGARVITREDGRVRETAPDVAVVGIDLQRPYGLDPAVRFHGIDLADPTADGRLAEAFRKEGVEAVLHAAFRSRPRADLEGDHEFETIGSLHLLHACGRSLNWDRLLARFDHHWPVLFSHLVLFQFAYPDRRSDIPRHVLDELSERLRRLPADDAEHVCYGTLLSREQYLFDLNVLGYDDARLEPRGGMSQNEIMIWTEAINKK